MLNELWVILAYLLYQEENWGGKIWKQCWKKPRTLFGKRIELRSVESLYFTKVLSNKLIKKINISLWKNSNVSRNRLVTSWMKSKISQNAVMKSKAIWYTNKEESSQLQNSENLVINPKYFFNVLKNLISNNKIQFAISKW